ncbi:MAG TPA: phosphogluconate dehydratase, partial [Burkholderiaceae bacterium]|nr:phosphogluconate dehydratase [Burkholderiaceae bacterium]
MARPAVNAVVQQVTDRIRKRSQVTRETYLAHVDRAASAKPTRARLSCTNFAHGFAASTPDDKFVLREARKPNIGIVSAYNDMLSAHQPFERFP